MNKVERILVADDDPEMIKQLLNVLTSEGFQVFTCQDGDQVLKLSKEKLPDIILLDWVMPRKTGIEAIIELKDDSSTYEIPIIMLTGQSAPKDLEHALNIGADDFIKKPFSKVELISRIRKQLKQQQLVREIQNLKLSQMYSLNQNLTKELTEKKEELITIESNVMLRNALLERVQKKIDELDSLYANAKSISTEIKNLLENKAEESSASSSDKYTGNSLFKDYLKKKFPSLTDSELTICSIVLFGLKNSEIAEKLFVSVRTIENHRYHIGKKLEIPVGIHLKDYLKKLEDDYLFSGE